MQERQGCTRVRQYRGKRLDNGEWAEGWYVQLAVTESDSIGETFFEVTKHYIQMPANWDYSVDHMVEVDPATVGQFTGRETVIDEKLIFRGDILSFVKPNYDGSDNGVETGYVDWSDSALSWIVRENIGSAREDWLYLILHNDDGVEVIGNIHDNPELLEVPQG